MADWQDLASAADWPAADRVSSERLWELRNVLRQRLVAMARATVRKSHLQRGATVAELGWTESILDPDVLTIGFARRVSTYKRLTLMLRDPARLRAILLDPDRPVQIVIAGKAHPADDGGKRYMQEMVRFTDDPTIRHRIAFLPDYDMGMAAILCAGADVWLNNPIRPQEASGTSGMKAAANGVVNVSVLDGWWDEGWTGDNGWAIGGRETNPDEGAQDWSDVQDLYRLLEEEIAPRYYDRDADGLPQAWVDIMRRSMSSTLWRFSTTRMLHDYVDKMYLPAAAAGQGSPDRTEAVERPTAATRRVRRAATAG
jgi:starch phosphorylase